jgi:hypothetical protein
MRVEDASLWLVTAARKKRQSSVDEERATHRAAQAIDGEKAWAEYLDAQEQQRRRTARLRALRLARDHSK